MSKELYKGYWRTRCDKCRRLMDERKPFYLVVDTTFEPRVEMTVCSRKCQDAYWRDTHQPLLPLPPTTCGAVAGLYAPSSYTGVNRNLTAENSALPGSEK